ncbi:MAG: YceI family protein [Myxococcales bacterium]|nr:YceI family protein [Myxococcales bacterium]
MRCNAGYPVRVRSPFAPVLLPLAALIASLVRWLIQGSGNLYTALDKRFYIPDPDLGWRVSSQHPIWLGLEVCAIIAATAIGLLIGGWVIRKLEARRGRRMTVLRVASWIVAVVPLAVPIAAFASGAGPIGGRDVLPAAQAVALETGISGALDAPAGSYTVVPHTGTAITARVSAGGEEFDARFIGDIKGTWDANPRDLAKPTRAEVSVATASVDTGIGERSKHAREGYLLAGTYPRLIFTLAELVAARQDTPNVIAFRARGTLALIGKVHPVEVTGTLSKPDAAGLARLGLSGDILLVNGSFSIPIRDTALAPDAGDFDGDRIPVFVSLVLRHME